jgi:hypothetical protein
MPYKRVGKTIYHKKDGKWSVKQTCGSIAAAKKAMNLLHGVEHGWEPTGEQARAVTKMQAKAKKRK